MPYIVLLYYHFVHIDDAESFWRDHKKLCQDLDLKGRILIASEGLNGTVAGTSENIALYKKILWQDSRFATMTFKESPAETVPFQKLKIKLRPEVISLHQDVPLDPHARGEYISPAELEALYNSNEEFYIVDARNVYESDVGAFNGAILPEIQNFRELPDSVASLSELRHKKVVTYCTGGIRCEKASSLLKNKGFQDVYQLEGGIVSYLMQFPNSNFQGSCYVFDDRMQLTQDEIARHGSVSRRLEYQEQ